MAADGPVIAVGEVLWDLLPDGPRLGGAPFNVAAHLVRLGRSAELVSAVGDDELGRRTLEAVAAAGVGTGLVSVVPGLPTGTAGVTLDRIGTPTFAIHQPAAYERTSIGTAELGALAARRPSAIVFGTLAQRSPDVLATTRQVIGVLPPGALRVYDPNLRPETWTPALIGELMGIATVTKVSSEELGEVAAALGLPTSGEAFATAAVRRLGLLIACVTSGGDGVFGASRDGTARAAGIPVAVADTVGAGDAFTAALVDGLLAGMPTAAVLRRANALGALVASRQGAHPAWTLEELAALETRERGVG